MALSEQEREQPASSRYRITVIGGDAVFLHDQRIGQKVYIGAGTPLRRPDLRRHVANLNRDLHQLSIGEFFDKYGLVG